MNIQELKQRYNPLMVALVIFSLCVALWLVHTRYLVEKRNDTVEMTADYQAILMMADRDGQDGKVLLEKFKKAGITTLAVYDATLEKLDRAGSLIAVPGWELQKQSPGYRGGVFDPLLKRGAVNPDAVYVAPGRSATAFAEAREDLRLRYGRDRVRMLPEAPEVVEVLGDSRVMDKFDFQTKTPIMQGPLGLSSEEMRQIKDAGFKVAVRPQNYLPVTDQAIESIFNRIEKSGAKVTTYIPCGTQVIGYPRKENVMAAALAEHNIRLGLVEHVTQLQFARFQGLDPLLQAADYNAVRVYNIAPAENAKLTMGDALRRWALSDEERNIRVNYIRFFLKPEDSVDVIPLNLDYVTKITEQVKERGFKIGTATTLQKLTPEGIYNSGRNKVELTERTCNSCGVFPGSYFPGKGSLALLAVGIFAGLALYLGLLFPGIRGKYQIGLVAVGTLVAAGTLFAGRGLLTRQILAFLSATIFPVLSISLMMAWWDRMGREERSTIGIIGTALWQLALAVLLSLVGATFIAAVLGDTRFFLEADIYRGVKLTFILPVLLTLILFLKEHDVFGSGSGRSVSLVKQLRDICNIRLTLGSIAIIGVLLFVAYIFVGRSGHTDGVPVPAIEIKLRIFLEQLMYARPREKEFLIGHPAFFLAVFAACRNLPNIWKLLFTLGAVIGQGSLVQTFCHMRTPVIMSYIRALDGYALGAALGIIAVIAAALLLPRLRELKRRLEAHE